eukprot:TRINITY_DN20073_c0_g3_i1.p1 TRINITY_DN20073_c0_g3~~TRINITY_DN20073_c0_g3_i1.p1  ORF type:complete len:638 (-),score=114.93 TRINITY_DN20073_c0_g3_i1:40-1953(-)
MQQRRCSGDSRQYGVNTRDVDVIPLVHNAVFAELPVSTATARSPPLPSKSSFERRKVPRQTKTRLRSSGLLSWSRWESRLLRRAKSWRCCWRKQRHYHCHWYRVSSWLVALVATAADTPRALDSTNVVGAPLRQRRRHWHPKRGSYWHRWEAVWPAARPAMPGGGHGGGGEGGERRHREKERRSNREQRERGGKRREKTGSRSRSSGEKTKRNKAVAEVPPSESWLWRLWQGRMCACAAVSSCAATEKIETKVSTSRGKKEDKADRSEKRRKEGRSRRRDESSAKTASTFGSSSGSGGGAAGEACVDDRDGVCANARGGSGDDCIKSGGGNRHTDVAQDDDYTDYEDGGASEMMSERSCTSYASESCYSGFSRQSTAQSSRPSRQQSTRGVGGGQSARSVGHGASGDISGGVARADSPTKRQSGGGQAAESKDGGGKRVLNLSDLRGQQLPETLDKLGARPEDNDDGPPHSARSGRSVGARSARSCRSDAAQSECGQSVASVSIRSYMGHLSERHSEKDVKKKVKDFVRQMVKGRKMGVLCADGSMKSVVCGLSRALDVFKIKTDDQSRKVKLADVERVIHGFPDELGDLDMPLDDTCATLALGNTECISFAFEEQQEAELFTLCMTLFMDGQRAQR